MTQLVMPTENTEPDAIHIQRDSLLSMLKLLIVATDLHYTSIDVRNKARDLVKKVEGEINGPG